MRILAPALALAAGLSMCVPAAARSSGEPIKLVWLEGDVAGMTAIYGPDGGSPIGFVEYHQKRRGDLLSSVRIAHFRDGSSDEDSAVARVNGQLEALSGRSITRDTAGQALTDVQVDVAGRRIAATWGRGEEQHTMDEHVDLPAGTYWGPLIFIVLKNFDANAEDGRLVFRTVAPSPKPIVLDMELSRGAQEAVERTGTRLDTRHFELRPTVHWALDPLVRMVAPTANFWTMPGEPPALVRFAGPRNYARQPLVIQ